MFSTIANSAAETRELNGRQRVAAPLTINTNLFQQLPLFSNALTSAPILDAADKINYANAAGSKRSKHFVSDEAGPEMAPAEQHCTVYLQDADGMHPVNVTLTARLDRGFARSGSSWITYRRNFFRAVVQARYTSAVNHQPVSVSNTTNLYVDVNGSKVRVNEFLVGINASSSITGRFCGITQVLSRRNKEVRVPSLVPISLTHSSTATASNTLPNDAQATAQQTVTIDRLQFRTSTINNPRKINETYSVNVDLYANIETLLSSDQLSQQPPSSLIHVARTHSAPIVVRGRSPIHYMRADEEANGTPNSPRRQSVHLMDSSLQSPLPSDLDFLFTDFDGVQGTESPSPTTVPGSNFGAAAAKLAAPLKIRTESLMGLGFENGPKSAFPVLENNPLSLDMLFLKDPLWEMEQLQTPGVSDAIANLSLFSTSSLMSTTELSLCGSDDLLEFSPKMI